MVRPFGAVAARLIPVGGCPEGRAFNSLKVSTLDTSQTPEIWLTVFLNHSGSLEASL